MDAKLMGQFQFESAIDQHSDYDSLWDAVAAYAVNVVDTAHETDVSADQAMRGFILALRSHFNVTVPVNK